MIMISKLAVLNADAATRKLPRFSAPASFLQRIAFYAFYLTVVFGVFSDELHSATAQNVTDSYFSFEECRRCVENYDPQVDYFSVKVQPDTSIDWTVNYQKSYKIIENRKQEKGVNLIYAYLCGTPEPEIPQGVDAITVEIPIRNYLISTATHAGYFEELAQLDNFVGYPYPSFFLSNNGLPCFSEYANDPNIAFQDNYDFLSPTPQEDLVEWLEDITSPGGDYSERNLDAIFIDYFGGLSERFANIPEEKKDSAPIIEISESASTNVIQHLEWVEYVSLFFNKEALAANVVDSAKALYECHKSKVNTQVPKTKVLYLSSCPTTGEFADPTYNLGSLEEEYYTGLIEDANGEMTKADGINPQSQGSVTIEEFEQYFSDVGNAVDVVIVANTLTELCNFSLPAFETSSIFELDNPSGVNFWFGARFVLPDRTLREFITMIQPTGNDPKRVIFRKFNDTDDPDFIVPNGTCNLYQSYDSSSLTVPCDALIPDPPINIQAERDAITSVEENCVQPTPSPTSGSEVFQVQGNLFALCLTILCLLM